VKKNNKPPKCRLTYTVGLSSRQAGFLTIQKLDDYLLFRTSASFATFQISAKYFILQYSLEIF